MGDEACLEGFDDSDKLPIEPWPEPVDGRARTHGGGALDAGGADVQPADAGRLARALISKGSSCGAVEGVV